MQLYNAVWIKKLQAIVLPSLSGAGGVFHETQVPSLPLDKQPCGPWYRETIFCVPGQASPRGKSLPLQ